MQKMVTLNTCCDTACLTFQLPYVTGNWFFSEPPTTTHRLFSELPTFERTQHTFSQMKKFNCNSQVRAVTFGILVGGDPGRISRRSLASKKLESRSSELSCAFVFGILCLAVLEEHRLVMDRRTDTDTDTGPWLVPRMHSIMRKNRADGIKNC